mmetsp:Transcript_49490/g.159829  ORF Transcript_49490/g.159829 Transcript_49490/m.159829 type:complete len:96 (+) Transcript_49490:607-894(+)
MDTLDRGRAAAAAAASAAAAAPAAGQGAPDRPLWRKFRDETREAGGRGCWYWREDAGDWFLEDDPGPWTKYQDPDSGRAFWCKDLDADWFWDQSG